MSENDKKPEPRRPDWLDDDGEAAPSWAELPRLDVGDQASVSKSLPFIPPPPAAPGPLGPELIPPPPGVIVLNDDFAARRRALLRADVDSVSEPEPVRQQPVVYGIVVRNTTAAPMYEVRVEHDLPPGPRFVGADPAPQLLGRRLAWNVGTIEPGARQRFKVTVQPNRPDELPADATALFRVYQCLHSETRVLRPAVTATVRLPEAASAGEQVTLVVEGHNTGPGVADDVHVVVPLPPGLAHPEGPVLQFVQPRLMPGRHLYVEAELLVEHGGEFTVPARLIAGGKLLADVQATLRAVGPRPAADTVPQSPVDAMPSPNSASATDGKASDETEDHSPAPSEPAGAPPGPDVYVLFMLAEVCFALPAARVTVATPRAVPTDMRVIDLRQRIKLPTEGPAARALLTRAERGSPGAALLVDRTVGVRRLKARPGSVINVYTAGVADDDGLRVTVLDLNALLHST